MHAGTVSGGDEKCCVTRQGITLGEVALSRVRLELYDAAGGKGSQGQWVELLQQGVAKFGVVIVETPVEPCAKKREALQQPFDVGVWAFVRGQLQTSRHFRVALGKTGTGVA